jgi:hypothetical protein
MSLFETTSQPCPLCGESTSFALVHSVNADRRKDLREAILTGMFQRQACPRCGVTFRMQPEMTYLDIGRQQWIGAFPFEKLRDWQTVEQNATDSFARAFGESASPLAKELGEGIRPRITFGWPALCEKIVAAQAGLDDVNLELFKVALIRGVDESPLSGMTELRFIETQDDGLILDWLVTATEQTVDRIRAPRSLYDEIAADQNDWQPLRDEISTGLFVDVQRLLIPAT